MPVPDLTPMQARFVAEWQKDQNGTQAAIRAGANPNSAHVTASKWLKLPKVVAALEAVNATAIQRVTESLEDAAGSAVWIVEKVVEIVERAMTPLPVYYRGEPTTEMQFAGGTAVAALALLAKRHPEFRESSAGADSGAKHLHLHGLGEAELRALASGFSST